eukprot:2704666-Amphidinium_carterae.1
MSSSSGLDMLIFLGAYVLDGRMVQVVSTNHIQRTHLEVPPHPLWAHLLPHHKNKLGVSSSYTDIGVSVIRTGIRESKCLQIPERLQSQQCKFSHVCSCTGRLYAS